LNQKQNKKVNEMEVAESRAYQKQQAGYVGQPTPKKHKEYNR
jgi:hypothetical protein